MCVWWGETLLLRAPLLTKAEGPLFFFVLGGTAAGEGLMESLLTRDPRSAPQASSWTWKQ